MPTSINPSFFDDSLIKNDDPNAWKSYTGRPNPALRNSNLQPISELPESHDLRINTIEIQQNNRENERKLFVAWEWEVCWAKVAGIGDDDDTARAKTHRQNVDLQSKCLQEKGIGRLENTMTNRD